MTSFSSLASCGSANYCSCDPRDAPSFPTRRSSDLPSATTRPAPAGPAGCRTRDGHRLRSRALLTVRARSEEHTSELQSRGHLVCRLLLEKKKILRHWMDVQIR